MVDFADIMRKANADESGGGSTSSNNSSGGSSGLVDDARNGMPSDAEPNNFKARVLDQERAEEKVLTPKQDRSEDEMARQQVEEAARKYGLTLNEDEKGTLKNEAMAGNDLSKSLPKVTGIDPIILAMAAEAAQGARNAGMGDMRDHNPATVSNGVAQVQSLSTAVERAPEELSANR